MAVREVGRACVACRSEHRREVDAALLAGRTTYWVATQYGLSQSGVDRHLRRCLGRLIRQSQEARMLADTASLIAELNRLHGYVSRVLERSEAAQDDRLVLYGVDTGRRNVEVLAKIGPAGEFERRLAALEGQKGPADAGDEGAADAPDAAGDAADT